MQCCVFEIENGGVGTLEIKTLGGSVWKGSSNMLLQFVFATLCCICSYSVSYKGGQVGQDKYCIVVLNSREETSCSV